MFGPFRLMISGLGLLTTVDGYSEAGVFRGGLLSQGQVANKRISEQGHRYFTVESGVPQGPYMDSDSDSICISYFVFVSMFSCCVNVAIVFFNILFTCSLTLLIVMQIFEWILE